MTPAPFWTRLRRLLAPLSPRRRRYERFLASLTLDPDRLPRPLPAPGPRDFIICGAPRTGTTLLAAMLFQPPHVLTVMEPWDGMRLPPRELFASLRTEIAETGRLARGKLDVSRLRDDGAVRWGREGDVSPALATSGDWLLGVKWPSYWRYLELLPETKFLVCLRDPVEVLNSFRAKGGRLGQGLEYDVAFNRHLNERLQAETDDEALRRVLLYERIHEAILPFLERPNVMAVRYERWFEDSTRLLDDIGLFLGADLGAPPATVRPSPRELDVPAEELGLLREHCRTSGPLGYEVTT